MVSYPSLKRNQIILGKPHICSINNQQQTPKRNPRSQRSNCQSFVTMKPWGLLAKKNTDMLQWRPSVPRSKKKYPVDAMEFAREEYRYAPVETIRVTQNATMFKVLYVPDPSTSPKSKIPLQVLAVNTNKFEYIYELTKEYTLAKRYVHKNLVGAHASFKQPKKPGDKHDQLWVVMPLVSRVSLKSMMMSWPAFRHGLLEPVVAFILKEILEGLDCIHSVGDNVHGNVCAGCIYMDETTVKLAFRSLMCQEIGTSLECDMAPELTEHSRMPYGKAADIWAFGLLILELVYGEIPVSTHGGLESFINNLVPKSSKCGNNSGKVFGGRLGGRSPSSSKVERISGPLADIIRACLRQDPKKRPTAKELLQNDYFKFSRGTGYDVKRVLVQLKKHAIS